MDSFFSYRGGELFAEEVSIRSLAERHGTPLYVYSRNHLRRRYRELTEAMAEVNPLVCYSAKANTNGAILRTFIDLGSGVDIVSGGELYRALRAGADPKKIVFAGVGKTRAEIEYALRTGILFFTVESEPEARRISDCAVALNCTGRIAFRVNPDVDPKTHRYVSTGKKENKFGLDIARCLDAYRTAEKLPNLEISGLHLHIGSQLLSAEPYGQALAKVRELCVELRQRHSTFRYLDIGGGLGIQYRPDHERMDPAVFARQVLPTLKALGLQVVLEPGRCLVGNAGILVCQVQYVKDNPLKKFVVVDAGMNDLIRPSLYEAYHEIVPVRETAGPIHGDLVGPICESGDFLALDRDLPAVGEGDLLAVLSAGAYGFSMASSYNSRPRPAEILVDGAQSLVVRSRETWEDLVQRESIC